MQIASTRDAGIASQCLKLNESREEDRDEGDEDQDEIPDFPRDEEAEVMLAVEAAFNHIYQSCALGEQVSTLRIGSRQARYIFKRAGQQTYKK